MPRKYTRRHTKPLKRAGHRHHENKVPKREAVDGWNWANSFVFSDKITDWQSKRAGKRIYRALF